MTSFESARTCTVLGENRWAAWSPAMSALYSATLLVVTPMRSLTAARRVGGVVDGSITTAPIAEGPGLPREPPSAKTTTTSVTTNRSRHEDGAAVVAVRDRAF